MMTSYENKHAVEGKVVPEITQWFRANVITVKFQHLMNLVRTFSNNLFD